MLALLERGGDVRSFPVSRTTLANIRPITKQHTDPSTHLVTDESPVYYFMAPESAKHSTVNHKAKEYVRKEAGSMSLRTPWNRSLHCWSAVTTASITT